MFVLALLLLLVVAAVLAAILLAGTADTIRLDLDPLGLIWETTPLLLFLLGAVTTFVLLLALALFRSASRRRLDQRRELKRLRQAAKDNDQPGAAGYRPGTAQGHSVAGGSGGPTDTPTAAQPGDGTSAGDTMYADPDRR